MSALGEIAVGKVDVFTTSGRGHDADFYIDRIMDKLMHVSETAPPAIKDQALAFKDQMRLIVTAGLKTAIKSDRNTTVMTLRGHGMDAAANLVASLQNGD